MAFFSTGSPYMTPSPIRQHRPAFTLSLSCTFQKKAIGYSARTRSQKADQPTHVSPGIAVSIARGSRTHLLP